MCETKVNTLYYFILKLLNKKLSSVQKLNPSRLGLDKRIPFML